MALSGPAYYARSSTSEFCSRVVLVLEPDVVAGKDRFNYDLELGGELKLGR